jgi:ribonuclease R
VPQRELLHRLQVGPERGPAGRRGVRRRGEEGTIRPIRGARSAAAAAAHDGIRGILHPHGDGGGLVVPERGGEDVFVGARDRGRARSGDHVAVRPTGRDEAGRLQGVVVRVLERRGREVLGVFQSRGRDGVVQPFDPLVGETIRIPAGQSGEARHMDVVSVQLHRRGTSRAAAEGRVLQRIGGMEEAGTDVAVVIRKHGLATLFPDDALAAAAALPSRVAQKVAAARERFDDPPPVTIDGETAKDFDDAIAVAELPRGGFRLWVHIADVAHFVPEDGALDLEARRRGTSVYFPDRVLPMFPEELSNGLCSLRPEVDRLVQSVIVDFGARGKVSRVRFADGVIRSAARLTYNQVAQVLEGRSPAPRVAARIAAMLRAGNRLREVLERRRHARGSIDFDLPEPQILLDVEGEMTGIAIEPRNEAHRMIEEFMLAANEAVAGHLHGAGFPCAYRIHEPPDPDKLRALADFVEGFGVRLPDERGEITSRAIQRMIEGLDGRPEQRVISQVALRSLKQARYSPENVGHFGLASPVYCHFTSPIRRYPDLIVHRLLRAARTGGPRGRAADETWLQAATAEASELERDAEGAERELLQWKKVAFIAGRVGEVFEGVVTGVARFGLFVQLIANQVEGLVRVDHLGQDWFDLVPQRLELRGRATGQVFRLGDSLAVRVERVDRVLQRVDLAPAGQRKRPAPGPTRRRGSRR